MDATLFAVIPAIFTLAGIVKGATGLGLPAIAIRLLDSLMAQGAAWRRFR
jgi:hypothetical protein